MGLENYSEEVETRLPKYEILSRDIEQAINDERLLEGDPLPPEAELAEIYGVSRGTVRRALSDLAQKNIISTKNGVGSRVAFRDQSIDDPRGWGAGFISSGTEVSVEILRIEKITDSNLAKKLALPQEEFIAIDRCRRLPSGTVISLEYSRISAELFPDLPKKGLVDNSLTSTIRRAGLKVSYGQETVQVAALDEHNAAVFARPIGTRFMVTEKSMFDDAGTLVEYVKSYLDPDHFTYRNIFKDA